MTVESLSMCKVLCKDCKNKIVPINFTSPDGYPVPAPEYDWKCGASPKGYRCTDGKPDGYDLCGIVNDKGDCELFESNRRKKKISTNRINWKKWLKAGAAGMMILGLLLTFVGTHLGWSYQVLYRILLVAVCVFACLILISDLLLGPEMFEDRNKKGFRVTASFAWFLGNMLEIYVQDKDELMRDLNRFAFQKGRCTREEFKFLRAILIASSQLQAIDRRIIEGVWDPIWPWVNETD